MNTHAYIATLNDIETAYMRFDDEAEMKRLVDAQTETSLAGNRWQANVIDVLNLNKRQRALVGLKKRETEKYKDIWELQEALEENGNFTSLSI